MIPYPLQYHIPILFAQATVLICPKYKNSCSNPSVSILYAIADALHIDTDELFGENL